MYRKIIVFIVLLSSAAAGGVYLAPDSQEIALMKLKDASFQESFEHYKKIYEAGNKSINVLIPLVKLYVYYGDIDKAIDLLEDFVAKNPASIEGRKQLAEFYKISQRFYNYCKHLEILQSLSPSSANLRELADTYDFLGLYKNEIYALERLVISKGYRLRNEDYVNLVSFYRKDKQRDKAVHTMLSYLNITGYNVNPDHISLALQLLLETGDEPKAQYIAKTYLEKFGKEPDAIAFSSVFLRKKKLDFAYALLVPYLNSAQKSSALLQHSVTVQMAQGKNKEIYEQLAKYFSDNTLPDTLSVTLIDIAMEQKNYDLVKEVINKANLDNMAEDALVRYAGLAFQIKSPELAKSIQSKLGQDYLAGSELLSAILDVTINNSTEAQARLRDLPKWLIDTPEYKLILANIYLSYGYSKQAFALFGDMPVQNMLETLDAAQIARLYIDSNATAEIIGFMDTAKLTSTPAIKAKINDTNFLLYVAKGEEKKVMELLKDRNHKDNALLADAYWFAYNYKHPRIALVLAEYIYNNNKSMPNRLQYAEALLQNRRYSEATGHLYDISQQDNKARALYIYSLVSWIRHEGMAIVGQQREMINNFLVSILKQHDLSLDEERNLAYLLAETGFTDKAEEIFLELAQGQAFYGHDVTELLNFWGDKPSPSALKWMENRAREASDKAKSLWFAHFNAINHPEIVLEIVDKYEPTMPQAVCDEYISALVLKRDYANLEKVLDVEITRENDYSRLKKLAVIARQEDLQGIALQGWRKVYDSNPQNPEATKELGIVNFITNRYSEAQQLIEQYLKLREGDYQVNYIYGEILYRKKSTKEAKPYFAKAKEQLDKIKNKDLGMKMTEAHLLYRIGHAQDSIKLYRSLLQKNSRNKSLRANFAEVLIDSKNFDEAALLLDK